MSLTRVLKFRESINFSQIKIVTEKLKSENLDVDDLPTSSTKIN